MRRNTKLTFAIGSAIVTFTFCFLAANVFKAYTERSQAGHMLQLVQQVRVGQTTHAAVIEMTNPLKGRRREWKSGKLPALEVSFDNEAIAGLKLAPYTVFRTWFVFKDGITVQKHASEYVPSYGCAASVTETARLLKYSGESAPSPSGGHAVYQNWSSANTAKTIVVEDTENNGEAQRQRDWNFELSCLTRLHGCRDARLMLPNVQASH